MFSFQAVGEPPLFLASSVFYAIKDAISAARAESGLKGPFKLDSPASAERIRNTCVDHFTKLVRRPPLRSESKKQFFKFVSFSFFTHV